MSEALIYTKTVELFEGQYMDELFPFGVPTDTIVDKCITNTGGTTAEIEAPRHSIIIVPNRPVIDGKQKKHPNIKGVREGITPNDILEYLNNDSIVYKKILVTPESYYKVKEACESYFKSDETRNIYNYFFFMIDECEKAVQDSDFREDIILPFFDLFEYKEKCLMSATPLYPNLEGFRKHLFYEIKIEPQFPFKKDLLLVATNNVIKEFIKQIKGNDNKIAIFLNSVDYPKLLIAQANIKDRSKIYTTTDELRDLRREGFTCSDTFDNIMNEQYSFFTSRYYSAVDMEVDFKPDVIMITDCLSKPQTIIDPLTHSVQISGRFRNGVTTLTHITNYNKNITYRTREDIIQKLNEQKTAYEAMVNLKELLTEGGKDLLKEINDALPFSRFIFKQGVYKGKYNPFLVENYIHKETIKSLYNHPSHLYDAYKRGIHFDVTYQYSPYEVSSGNVSTRKNLTRRRKEEIVERLQILIPRDEADERLLFTIPTSEIEEELYTLRQEAPVLCRYYELFGANRIREINYDMTIMKRSVRGDNKDKLYLKPLNDIYEEFTLNVPYSETQITEKLQSIFDKYELKDDDGEHLKAKATDIGKYFEISTRITIPSTREKGYMLLSYKFNNR